MDLTAIDQATDEEKEHGMAEWGEAFTADNWEEVQEIQNPAIKEAAKTMEMIMKNPTERELVRAGMDALNDQHTMVKSAERRGEKRGRELSAKNMKLKGYSYSDIEDITGLSAKEIDAL